MLISKLSRFIRDFSSKGETSGSAAANVASKETPNLVGFVEQRSRFHVSGWLHDTHERGARIAYEVRHRLSGVVLATDVANHFRYGLSGAGVGDGGNAFYLRFNDPLSEDEVDQIDVVPTATGVPLENAPWITSTYEPVVSFSMDIVDNCNLRCPFCLYDYSNTRRTHTMSDEVLNAALRFMEFVPDGSFWFSCLHEPTLHPKLIELVERIPTALRRKAFFTTNLSKRMPPSYFSRLAGARLHNINISIESLQPLVFEKFRKGARFEIFRENWDSLITACERLEQPTPLRYIAMAYKSNLRELPDLARYLLGHRRASMVEIRYTFDYEHIPQDFRSNEFLTHEDWLWLREALKDLDDGRVRVIFPPSVTLPADRLALDPVEPVGAAGANAKLHNVRYFLPFRYQLRLESDGKLEARRHWGYPYDQNPPEDIIAKMDVVDVLSPQEFLSSLPS